MQLDKASRAKLQGAHPDLTVVIERAAEISGTPFKVIEGARTVERQKRLLAQGMSKTMNSRHIPDQQGVFHAVDVVPLVGGQISWSWPHYYPLANAIKRAARELDIPIEWGGDWKSFKDGPHWQLPWREYPGAAREVAHLAPLDPRHEHDLSRSRTMQGSMASLLGGGTVAAPGVRELVWTIQDQKAAMSTGDWLSIAVGVIVIAGAIYAMYARWDDAGRPSPFNMLK